MIGQFDPLDKNNKAILEYFGNKTWLIIDNSGNARTAIKESLTKVGAKIVNMSEVDNFLDAKRMIEFKRPHYVIGSNIINGGSSIDLFATHREASPNRINSGFFIITEEGSLSDVASALEYEMDGIIIQPFNSITIIDSLIDSIKHKLNPTPYYCKIEEGRENYIRDNLETAMLCFANALTLNKSPYEAHYLLGSIYSDKNLIELAIKSFEDAIACNPDYFKALNKLSSLYYQNKDFKKAYELNLAMSQQYPTAKEKIPELIRLSIINKRYEDINLYLKIFTTFENPDPETQNFLSAGLATLGKNFINLKDYEHGIEALRGAFKYSNGKYEILKSIAQTLQDHKRLDVMMDLFDKADFYLWSDSVQGLYFYILELTSDDDQKVLTVGEQYLKKGTKDVLIYKCLLERGIKMKRKKATLELMIKNAIEDFPDHEAELEAYLARIKHYE